jgi:hypothetical protein
MEIKAKLVNEYHVPDLGAGEDGLGFGGVPAAGRE